MPSEKTIAYRNSNFVRDASKITYLGRLYNKNKPKHKGKQESFGKQVQASINCKQIQTRKSHGAHGTMLEAVYGKMYRKTQL